MIEGDNDTFNKFFAGINDTGWTTVIVTGNKFITDVNDTGTQLLPVTTTPTIRQCANISLPTPENEK